jgi:hypothetical protein
MKRFTPEFYGSEDLPKYESYLTIENLCHGKDKPSIMDLKLGTSTLTLRAS